MGIERRRNWLLLLLVFGLSAGCARLSDSEPGGGGGSAPIDHPAGSTDLVLRLEECCGFLPETASLKQVPSFSLYGDGRVITQGPQIEIYPPPALSSLHVVPLDEAGIQAILRAARSAGLLGPDRHYALPTVLDATTTTFTLVSGGARHVVSAYALGLGADSSLPAQEREARRALSEFRDALSDLRGWLPGGSVGREAQLRFEEVRVFVTAGAPQAEPELEQPVIEWPLPSPLSGFGEPLESRSSMRCGSVEGTELDALLPRALEANDLTPWRSEGLLYSLVFRPLLPDESGCSGAER
ncbi:MAG: hypothetical protein H0W27_04735 [Actinobacteria bacterium]|nr:hypothetical protein [Actinomycetota bacterium]